MTEPRTSVHLSLTGVTQRMQTNALYQDDKFAWMTARLVHRVQELANDGDVDQRLVDLARHVTCAWLESERANG